MAEDWGKQMRHAAATNVRKQRFFWRTYFRNAEVIGPSVMITLGVSLIMFFSYRKVRYDNSLTIKGPNHKWLEEEAQGTYVPLFPEKVLDNHSPIEWTHDRHTGVPQPDHIDRIHVPKALNP